MKENIDRSVWISYLIEFSKRNNSRPTRLEVFGENGAQEEEHGLPFAGISLERGNGTPSIAIMFSARNGDTPSHLTHIIENVQEITPKRGLDGGDEALEIVDSQGEISLLRFEPQPMISANSNRDWSGYKSPFEVLSSIRLPQPPAR
ncbi:MAG: hypothetical protein QOH41_1285 [Blastocatellia bacterium]|jgi:hypothetical protein|nr:hypothetical protein [Blastocatellia bacterium]